MKASSSLSSIFDRLKHCNPVHGTCLSPRSRNRRFGDVGGGGGAGGTTLRKSEPPQHVDMVMAEVESPSTPRTPRNEPENDGLLTPSPTTRHRMNENVHFIESEEQAELILKKIRDCSEIKKYNRRGSRSLDGSVSGGRRGKNMKQNGVFASSSKSTRKKGASTDDVVEIGFYDDNGFIRTAFRFDLFQSSKEA